MAAYLTHRLTADAVLAALPDDLKNKIRSYAAYYAGAEGGDPFFVYRPFRKKGYNLGRLLHRKNVYGFFRAAAEYTAQSGDYSYIFGYITHYAVDTVFHPSVYAAEYALLEELPEKRKKDKIHFLIEGDIDRLLVDRYAKGSTAFAAAPDFSEQDLTAICSLLAYATERACGVCPDEGALRRSLKRFFKRQSYFFEADGKRRDRFFRFEKALGLPHVLSYLFVGKTADTRFEAFGEHSVYELFEKAVEKSVLLIGAFCNEPDKERFSSDFNEGKRN